MRVLVVEDEPRMAALIRQGLEEEAYAVDVVENGRDVLLWVQSAEYDIILLDIMLPGMNGLDVCRQLRDEGFTTCPSSCSPPATPCRTKSKGWTAAQTIIWSSRLPLKN